MAQKTWTMNETQKDFMDTLKDFGRAVTLMEIEAVTGKAFKTGTINTLVAKELVKTTDVDLTYTETRTFTFGDKETTLTATKTITRKAYALNE